VSATDTPPPPRAGWFAATVTVALAIAIAWVLAKWTWALLAPPQAPLTPASGTATLDRAALASLFGGAPMGASVSGTDPSTGLRLKGVVAATKADAGSAIFNAGGKDFAVRTGEEIRPGMRLAGVLTDHVLVERAGARGRVDLEVWTSGAPARASASRAPGFRLAVSRTGANAYALSRKELDEALRDPGQLNFLGQIGLQPGGGVRLERAPANSLAARLGLQSGDVIRQVNGQPVTSAGDLARLHQQFATTSLIQAEVQRGTQTLQLSYTVNP
jgi:general secretion pathway protein C